MPAGDFLSGLARGIYGEQEKMRLEQQERDAAAQRNTIGVLADLYGKVRPESQHVILDQIGKAIGVKGKMKTFWQALSGIPDRSVEDQLGTQLRDLAGMSVTPKEAAGIESKADVARMFGASSPLAQMFQNRSPEGVNKQAAMDAEAGLRNKLIFRDPQQEQRDLVTERYEAQTRAALEKEAVSKALAAKYAGERDEANRKGRINQTFYTKILGAQSQQIGKAYQLWWDDYNAGRTQAEPGVDPGAIPPAEYMARAGQLLQGRFELQGKNINSQINYRAKQSNPGSKPMTPAQKAQIEQEITGEAQKLITSIGSARTKLKTAKETRDSLAKRLTDHANSMGVTFDPNTGLFMGDPKQVARANVMLDVNSPKGVSLVELYQKAKDQAATSESDLNVEFDKLRDKRYENRVQIGATPDEPISMRPQRGVKPAPATKGTGKVGLTTQKSLLNRGEQLLRIPPDTVQVGEEVPFKDGHTYRVVRKGKDHVIVKFIN